MLRDSNVAIQHTLLHPLTCCCDAWLYSEIHTPYIYSWLVRFYIMNHTRYTSCSSILLAFKLVIQMNKPYNIIISKFSINLTYECTINV